jgi:hypothetical protein
VLSEIEVNGLFNFVAEDEEDEDGDDEDEDDDDDDFELGQLDEDGGKEELRLEDEVVEPSDGEDNDVPVASQFTRHADCNLPGAPGSGAVVPGGDKNRQSSVRIRARAKARARIRQAGKRPGDTSSLSLYARKQVAAVSKSFDFELDLRPKSGVLYIQ